MTIGVALLECESDGYRLGTLILQSDMGPEDTGGSGSGGGVI